MSLTAMRSVKLTVVVVSLLMMKACGSSDSASTNPNPFPPADTVIPAGFSNSAETKQDLDERTTAVSSDIAEPVTKSLLLSSETQSLRPQNFKSSFVLSNWQGINSQLHLQQLINFRDEEERDDTYGYADLSSMIFEAQEGADCQKMYQGLALQISEMVASLESIKRQSHIVDEELNVVEDSESFEVSRVTSSGDRYAYHVKMKPTGAESGDSDSPFGDLFNFMKIEYEVAAGSSDEQVVMLFGLSQEMDFSNFPGADQTAAIKSNSKTEYFADLSAKSLSIAFKSTVVMDDDEEPMNFQMDGSAELIGGDAMKLINRSDVRGIIAGEAINGFASSEIEKLEAGKFRVGASGRFAGQEFTYNLTIEKGATSCKVTAVE